MMDASTKSYSTLWYCFHFGVVSFLFRRGPVKYRPPFPYLYDFALREIMTYHMCMDTVGNKIIFFIFCEECERFFKGESAECLENGHKLVETGWVEEVRSERDGD